MDLKAAIKKKKTKVVIIGLGYVGLPHAVEIANAGFSVCGIDIDSEKVKTLNRGISYINDVKNKQLQEVVINGRFKAAADFTSLKTADIVIICVPTPLDEFKVPNISYIRSAAEKVKGYLHREQIIILESTTYPGTTEEILLPLFEETGLKIGKDFYLAFAPERIDPGNSMPINDVPKVVGGITPKCRDLAVLFYRQFLKHIHPVSSTRVAEMTKVLENTYRLINISAINELALLCGKMGIDIWEVIEAAKTKPYGFQAFYPSPKIGGHCIPLDPFYLSYKAKEYGFWLRFIELAGEINEQMPHYVVTRINYVLNKCRKSINGSWILIWGAAYKKDINDPRESAIYDVIRDLTRKGAKVDYFDPQIKTVKIDKIIMRSIKYRPEDIKKYDLVVILTDHSGFDYDNIACDAKLVIDTRNAIKSRKHKNVSWM